MDPLSILWKRSRHRQPDGWGSGAAPPHGADQLISCARPAVSTSVERRRSGGRFVRTTSDGDLTTTRQNQRIVVQATASVQVAAAPIARTRTTILAEFMHRRPCG